MLDSAQLYTACRSGELQTQTQAYRQLWNYLLRVSYHLVRDQPDPEDLAQECAQRALVRIHQRLHECREPAAFGVWARRIVCNLTIDELRRSNRFTSLTTQESGDGERDATHDEESRMRFAHLATDEADNPSQIVLATMANADLRELVQQAPLSDRSRRVVVGRYFDALLDEELATRESALGDEVIRPSHVQVTRAKNLAKLRAWPLLVRYAKQSETM